MDSTKHKISKQDKFCFKMPSRFIFSVTIIFSQKTSVFGGFATFADGTWEIAFMLELKMALLTLMPMSLVHTLKNIGGEELKQDNSLQTFTITVKIDASHQEMVPHCVGHHLSNPWS